MDAWKLTDDELDGIVAALLHARNNGEYSKHGVKLYNQLTESQTARRRRKKEDEEWERSK